MIFSHHPHIVSLYRLHSRTVSVLPQSAVATDPSFVFVRWGVRSFLVPSEARYRFRKSGCALPRSASDPHHIGPELPDGRKLHAHETEKEGADKINKKTKA